MNYLDLIGQEHVRMFRKCTPGGKAPLTGWVNESFIVLFQQLSVSLDLSLTNEKLKKKRFPNLYLLEPPRPHSLKVHWI